MGWDVLIFKLKDPSTPVMALDESTVLPLGGPDAIRAAVNATIPAVDWSDPTWGITRILGCSLEFNLKAGDPLHLGIHVHGSGDPVTPIVALCKANGWVAFDTTLGEYIDLEKPNADGWSKFQAFRDEALARLKKE